MNRQSWTNQEDNAIRTLVTQFGVEDWTNISQKLKQIYQIRKRTGKQCRQRWYNHLNPAVNKKPWTNQEQTRLFEIHRKCGNKWKLMSKQFQGRTDNDIKNHFYSTLRRSLRRLNKFIGQKNSTTQMRQIKPSVLSTIMNYIYQQENCIQSNIVNSLKDLPYLIFQFSNYKPVKNKSKGQQDEQIKRKINFIFTLINSANSTYQYLKRSHRNQKNNKKNNPNSMEQQQQQQNQPHTHTKQHTKANNSKSQEIDFMKYLPKKTYTLANPILTINTDSQVYRKPKQKTVRIIKKAQYLFQGKGNEQKFDAFERQKKQKDLLNTDLMEQNNHHTQFFIKQQQESQPYIHSHKKQQENYPNQLHLRTRRISLQAHEDFMEDESIGDLEQPSQISSIYCNGLDGLVVVGKQIPLHPRQQKDQVQVKVQAFSSNENIDELIQMNYSN